MDTCIICYEIITSDDKIKCLTCIECKFHNTCFSIYNKDTCVICNEKLHSEPEIILSIEPEIIISSESEPEIIISSEPIPPEPEIIIPRNNFVNWIPMLFFSVIVITLFVYYFS